VILKLFLSRGFRFERIWFHLYDSGTGEPYKGCSTDCVALPSSSIIVELKDAVKKKHKEEDSNVLSGISASQLLVFKNKESFDKRNLKEAKVEFL
jgi:hypothetical protein